MAKLHFNHLNQILEDILLTLWVLTNVPEKKSVYLTCTFAKCRQQKKMSLDKNEDDSSRKECLKGTNERVLQTQNLGCYNGNSGQGKIFFILVLFKNIKNRF